jgi:glycosyltransferase involved in cell wall biosynthesis
MKRLAIITTHPIQYYAPVFKLIHQRQNISIKVFYTWGEAALNKHDPGFNKHVNWDVPLLDGYPYEFAQNTSKTPGSHHYNGIITPGLIGQVNSFKADAILVIGWSYYSHLKVLRYFKNKIPVLFRGDSTLLDPQPVVEKLLRSFFLKWVYSYIDLAFYPGVNTKAYFSKYGIADSKVIFAPHAIDNDRFANADQAEVQKLKDQLDIKNDELVVLFAGKFEEKKSPLLLIQAFIKLNKPGTHLLFVGNGILQSALKEASVKHSNIHFIDFQNQAYMPVVYHACDLFCLPSQGPNETWGLAVNEAMACGKAILVSDKVGCAANLVKQNHNGGIFRSNNINDLTIHLDDLTQSKQTLKLYGDRSKEMIKSWNFNKIAESIESQLLV